MADAIGSVRATFTASAGGMIGAIDQIVGKLGGFAAATKRTQAQTADYNKIVSGLADEFSRGQITAEEYAEKVGRVQGKFKGIGEAERMKAALAALSAAQAEAGDYSGVFDAAIEKTAASVRNATPPIERLSIDLAKNRADFLAGKVSMEQYKNTIATLPGEINGVETEQQQMERVFKETQETLRKLRTPVDDYETELRKLREQLDRGTIDEEQFTAAAKKAKDVLDKTNGSVKSVGDAFGGLPGPLGAAARAFDMMQKSMGSTMSGFKAGGIKGGVSNFVGQIQSGIANAGSTGGASLVGIAPQIAVIAGAAYAGYEALKQLTGALAAVGSEVERTAQLAGRLGVSFQEYEILAVAANNAGIETEALASAQTKGLKAISAARGGAEEQAKAFEALGISQEQLQNTSPNDILELAAAKLNAIQDPASRATLAMQIFGKAGNDILPALAGLDAVRAGIERLGGSMSNVDVERFKQVDDAFDNLGVAGSRLGRTLLAPFTELFARVANGFAAVTGGLSKAFAPIGNLFAEIGGAVGMFVERLGESLGMALRVVGALLQMSGITAIAAAIGAQVDQWGRYFAAVDSYMEPIIAGLEQVAAFVGDNITRAVTAIYTIFGNLVASTFEWVGQSDLLSGLFASLAGGANLIVDAFKTVGGWVSYVVAQLEYWAGIEPKPMTTPEDKEAIEAQMKAREDAEKAEEERAKKAQQRAEQIREGLLSPYEQMQQAVAELNDLEQRGLLTAEQRAAAESKIRDEFAKQDPLAQAAAKHAEDQKKASEEIGKKISDSAKAGKELGAAADPIRAQFASAAEQIKKDMEAGLISPEDAKSKMGEAVDAMNEELKRLGEDQKFAEKIRDSLKSEMEKVNDELDAIDKNQTLTADEKDRAKAKVREKAAENLPGKAQQDASDKFREAQEKLRDAMDAGIINEDQFRERMGNIREELEDSIADARDKQERNSGPDRRAVGAAEVNSSEGASTFFRLLRGQDDPTKKQLKEMEKQTRLLAKVADDLADTEVVQL